MSLESKITLLAQRIGTEVKRMKAAAIVADVVAVYDNTATGQNYAGTESDIAHYDTADLTAKDVVMVLHDETHDGNAAYYRWSKTDSEFKFEIAEVAFELKAATTTDLGGIILYDAALGTGKQKAAVFLDTDKKAYADMASYYDKDDIGDIDHDFVSDFETAMNA